MNTHISNFLKKYMDDPDPRYAVALTGKWGCGKSFFVDMWVKELEKRRQKPGEDEDSIELQPVYVSLYGMRTVGEVVKAINREMHPLLYSKGMQMLKGFAKIAGKVTLNANFDLNGNPETSEVSLSTSLDSLGFLKSKDDSTIRGDKLLIFDDFERSQIDTKELLGFINGFVERSACHVIVVGDFKKLEKESKDAYEEYKEKTIGKIFEVKPDPKKALDVFLAEIPSNDWTKGQKRLILECFRLTETNNLRLLRQSIRDFNSVIEDIEIKEKHLPFMKALLATFIMVSHSNADKDLRDLFKDYVSKYLLSISANNEYKEKISGLQSKYNPISERIRYNVLDPYNIQAVNEYLTSGTSMTEYIGSKLTDLEKEATIYEKLRDYRYMEDEEFNALYEELKLIISEESPERSLPEIAQALGWLIKFDNFSIRSLDDKLLDIVESRYCAVIEKAESSEEVFQTYTSFLHTLSSFSAGDKRKEDVLSRIGKIKDEKMSGLPNRMQLLLRSLDNENVEELETLDYQSAPDRQSNFTLTPIFANEDPELIFDRIEKLSNKGRAVFTDFLHQHYMLSFGVDRKTVERQLPDLPFLEKLCDLVGQKMITIPSGITQSGYYDLRIALAEAIDRMNKVKQ